MSCMVLTKRHIDHVIDAIKFDSRSYVGKDPIHEQTVLALGAEFDTPMGELLHAHDWENQLGDLLWNLNHEAYDTRYAHRDDVDFGYDWTYRYTQTPMKLQPLFTPQARDDAYTLVKVLDCFIYQCHEGEVAKHGALKILTDVRDAIIRFIFNSDARYNAAPWGIE